MNSTASVVPQARANLLKRPRTPTEWLGRWLQANAFSLLSGDET